MYWLPLVHLVHSNRYIIIISGCTTCVSLGGVCLVVVVGGGYLLEMVAQHLQPWEPHGMELPFPGLVI